MRHWRHWCAASLVGGILALPIGALGQIPNHPVITEVFTDPPGDNDGPFGRLPGNLHQEFIEMYLPPSASLSPTLNKDALRLTFYEVEGDSTSSGLGLVNYRFDFPTFDLDSSNGITAGAIARPSSGVVVLGWIDYTTTTPIVLAGAANSRIAMIHNGITTTGGAYTFIAMNGSQGGGTTNFPVPTAENKIDMPDEAASGVIQNGSAAYLLVNRDSASYVMLCDDLHTAECVDGSDPNLPEDSIALNTPALLDGFACNDHGTFAVIDQPYDSPTGDDIDLETSLPLGGAFSLLVAQVPESDSSINYPGIANGYARVFVNVPKTTETATADDPVTDATLAYRHARNDGPFFPTPGSAMQTTFAPELGLATGVQQMPTVLAQTTGRPGILAANVGGNFAVNLTAAAGASSNPAVATFSAGSAATNISGQSLGFPTVAIAAAAAAAHGATASATVTVTAANAVGGNPAVVAPVQNTTLTATVLKPTTGLSAAGLPLQTTVFAAIQGIAPGAAANEFRATSLGAHVAGNLGVAVQDTLSNGFVLSDSATNIGSGFLMQSIIRDFPDPGFFVNFAGPPGKLSLVNTVLQSAEALSGAATYDDSFEGGLTLVRAIRANIPDTLTFGGTFSPTETIHFCEATGRAGNVRSGLSNATTTRGFEIAILDTNVRDDNSLETGATDDFGIIVEVETTDAGSPVVPGEFVFLSFTGGLQGADIDGVNVPSVSGNIANVIYLDLDNLHSVLKIRTIEAIFLIDGNGSGELDVAEIFSLNPSALPASLLTASPSSGASLWRSSSNVMRLTFSQNIVVPTAGQMRIRQMLASGQFGADQASGFTFSVENDGGGNPRILRILDSGAANLSHRLWYAIDNAGTWPGVGDFEIQYVVQIGDANGDLQVLNIDAGLINAAIPTFGVPETDRRNVDSDTAILNGDVSTTNARIPSFPVAKPSGH